MSDMKDQHVGSDGAIVNPADTTPARVEGQPSSGLRGTPQGQDGDGAANDLTARLVCPQCGRKPPKRNIPPFSKCCGRTWREDSK